MLELLLNCLVSQSLSHEAAPVTELVSSLADEQISSQVAAQVVAWFGAVEDGRWKMDVDGVMREVGLGILRHHKVWRL